MVNVADDDSDEVLARAAGGDRQALDDVFCRFRAGLRRSVSMRLDRRLNGRVDPSDVIQDTFVDAVRRWAEFESAPERMPLLLWIRLLASQRIVDLHRTHLGAQMRNAALEVPLDQAATWQTSSVWLADQIVDRRTSASDSAAQHELRQQVHQALLAMDPIDREVLAMRHFEQLTNREVAQTLGISVTAASNRYIRALGRLKAILPADAGAS